MRRWVQICALSLSLLLLSACAEQGSVSPSNVTDISSTVSSAEDTEQSKARPTVTPKPTPKITLSPETSTQESKQGISVETHPWSPGNTSNQSSLNVTLPEGQFVVMEGEGRQYLLYDNNGEYLRSFEAIGGEYGGAPIGICRAEDIYGITDPFVKEEPNVTDEFDPMWRSVFEFCGGYVVRKDSQCDVYRRDGSLIFSKNADYFSIDANEKEIALFLSTETEVNIYHFSFDGTIVKENHLLNLPENYYPSQILSDQYFIADRIDYNSPDFQFTSSVFDMAGNEVMSNVEHIYCGLQGEVYWGVGYMYLYPYFSKDDVLYDSSLNPVASGTVDSDGDMIPGVQYSVDGIACLGSYGGYTVSDPNPMVAWGQSGDKMAVRYKDKSIVLQNTDGQFISCSESFVMIERSVDDMSWEYLIYSFDSGELLATLKDYVALSDSYALVYDVDESTYDLSYTVLDAHGQTVFETDSETLQPTLGSYLIMQRGPYFGITTLDGTWVVKGLAREYTGDTSLPYSYD